MGMRLASHSLLCPVKDHGYQKKSPWWIQWTREGGGKEGLFISLVVEVSHFCSSMIMVSQCSAEAPCFPPPQFISKEADPSPSPRDRMRGSKPSQQEPYTPEACLRSQKQWASGVISGQGSVHSSAASAAERSKLWGGCHLEGVNRSLRSNPQPRRKQNWGWQWDMKPRKHPLGLESNYTWIWLFFPCTFQLCEMGCLSLAIEMPHTLTSIAFMPAQVNCDHGNDSGRVNRCSQGNVQPHLSSKNSQLKQWDNMVCLETWQRLNTKIMLHGE